VCEANEVSEHLYERSEY